MSYWPIRIYEEGYIVAPHLQMRRMAVDPRINRNESPHFAGFLEPVILPIALYPEKKLSKKMRVGYNLFMAIFFISDIHLGEHFSEREKVKKEKLSAFLDMVSTTRSELYVVGDLFDFWFEYKHAIPKEHLAIILMLANLHNQGLKLTYITGNHDFWLGDFLSQEVGFKIYKDCVDVTIDGKKVHIIHGDGLAKNDKGYRLLKKVLRNPINIRLYRLVPPDLGIPFAKFISGTSRGHTQKRPKEEFLYEYRDYAHEKLKAGFDVVIMAHTHVPEEIQFEEGLYLNTGDWIENFTYVEYSDGKFKLKKWE